MSALLAVLQRWIAAAEAFAAWLPGASAQLAAGSWPALVLASALALALLLAGSRLPRVLAAGAGGLVGFGAGLALAGILRRFLPGSAVPWMAGIALAVAGAFAPLTYPAALGGLAGAVLGAAVPVAGQSVYGALVGGLLGGALAVLLRRAVLAGTAAVAGAVLAAVVVLALSPRNAVLTVLRERPVALAGLAALLAVAGTAFQLGSGIDRAGARKRESGGGPGPVRQAAEQR